MRVVAETRSAKQTTRYTTNFRADLADALNLNAYSILLDSVSATSVHAIIEVSIFNGFSETSFHALFRHFFSLFFVTFSRTLSRPFWIIC